MTLRTFAEIAEYAHIVEPSQQPGSINYCQMVYELAEALDRLEFNLAVQLALNGQKVRDTATAQLLTTSMLGLLRNEIPEGRAGLHP